MIEEKQNLIKMLTAITEIFNQSISISPTTDGFYLEITNKNKSVIFEFYKNRWAFRRWYFNRIIEKTYLPYSQMDKNYKTLQSAYKWLHSN